MMAVWRRVLNIARSPDIACLPRDTAPPPALDIDRLPRNTAAPPVRDARWPLSTAPSPARQTWVVDNAPQPTELSDARGDALLQPAATPGPWALRDARGNTPLHHAAATPGALAEVRRQVEAGADVNAVGSYGTRPLGSALWMRQTRIANYLRAHGAMAPSGALNEASERCYLASVFGVAGVTICDGVPLELMGAFDIGVYPLLAAAWQRFAATHRVPADVAARVHGALHNSIDLACGSVHAVQQALQHGDSVVLPTGWVGHSLAAVLHGESCVLVDRGHVPAWSVLHMPRGRTQARLIAFLQGQRTRPARRGARRMNRLRHLLQRRPSDAMVQHFARCPVQPLHVDNCVVANGKAAVLALLLLHMPSPAARALYKRFTAFLRQDTLQRYVRGRQTGIDAALVQTCREKLLTAGTSN